MLKLIMNHLNAAFVEYLCAGLPGSGTWFAAGQLVCEPVAPVLSILVFI